MKVNQFLNEFYTNPFKAENIEEWCDLYPTNVGYVDGS